MFWCFDDYTTGVYISIKVTSFSPLVILFSTSLFNLFTASSADIWMLCSHALIDSFGKVVLLVLLHKKYNFFSHLVNLCNCRCDQNGLRAESSEGRINVSVTSPHGTCLSALSQIDRRML